MTWTAWQYRDVYDALYAQCDEDEQRSLDNRLDKLLELGNRARRPVSAPVEDGIFELRSNGAARVLFYFEPGQRMIFVVGLFKKQRALPRSAIDDAKRIRGLLQSGRETASEIS